MANQSNFQPKQPVRTDTVDSQNSQSSGQLSPPMSPSSPTSPSRATSDFFGAITARVRGRSRSREAAKRSKSPMVSPPRQISNTNTPSAQPQHARQSSSSHPTRPPLQPANRRCTSGSDAWRGRHSNEWLFGGWSATETAKDLLNRRSK